MLKSDGKLARRLASCAHDAMEIATSHYDEKADENAITDQFIGAWTAIIRRENWGRNDVRAERVRDRGPGAIEAQTGADFVVKYTFETPEYRFDNGMLLQAKHYDTYDNDIDDLKNDCELMLRHSNSSFLVTYSPSEFYHYSASTLTGFEPTGYDSIRNKKIHRHLPYRQTRSFYETFFRGTVGDGLVHANWDYFVENVNHYRVRPFYPDGGQETDFVEGGPGIEISVFRETEE